MKVIVLSLLALVMVSLVACNAEKQDGAQTATADPNAHPGKAIHDANCISCHDTGKYTRADRLISDFNQLSARVRVCDANLGAKLSDKDLSSVTDYLNESFYKFPKP